MANQTENQSQPQAGEGIDPGMRALGMIETKGLVACIEAADAMIALATTVPVHAQSDLARAYKVIAGKRFPRNTCVGDATPIAPFYVASAAPPTCPPFFQCSCLSDERSAPTIGAIRFSVK